MLHPEISPLLASDFLPVGLHGLIDCHKLVFISVGSLSDHVDKMFDFMRLNWTTNIFAVGGIGRNQFVSLSVKNNHPWHSARTIFQ